MNTLMRWCFLSCALIAGFQSSKVGQAASILVTGRGSNNVVRFDVSSGAANVYATYAQPSLARDLALDASGQLYSSVDSGSFNVVKFVPGGPGGTLTSVDFTANIGDNGPGQIQFHNGDLYAAGGGSRQIIQYSGVTGAEIRRFGVTNDFNIRGMVIAGNTLYYAEVFQEVVRKMDLTQSPPTGATFFTDTTNLNEPIDLAIGGNGNLFVTNRANTLVQQYDVNTGAFAGTFANFQAFNPAATAGQTSIEYNPGLNNYFIANGDAVYRVSAGGNLLQTYQSPLLSGAYGVVVVPVPEASACFLGIAAIFGLVCVRRPHATRLKTSMR